MNAFNFVKENSKVYVNPEAGVVAIRLEPDAVESYILDGIFDRFKEKTVWFPSGLISACWYEWATKYLRAERMVAKATCDLAGGDVFNEEFGLDLARNRLTLKIRKCKIQFIEFIESELLKTLFKIEDVMDKV